MYGVHRGGNLGNRKNCMSLMGHRINMRSANGQHFTVFMVVLLS